MMKILLDTAAVLLPHPFAYTDRTEYAYIQTKSSDCERKRGTLYWELSSSLSSGISPFLVVEKYLESCPLISPSLCLSPLYGSTMLLRRMLKMAQSQSPIQLKSFFPINYADHPEVSDENTDIHSLFWKYIDIPAIHIPNTNFPHPLVDHLWLTVNADVSNMFSVRWIPLTSLCLVVRKKKRKRNSKEEKIEES